MLLVKPEYYACCLDRKVEAVDDSPVSSFESLCNIMDKHDCEFAHSVICPVEVYEAWNQGREIQRHVDEEKVIWMIYDQNDHSLIESIIDYDNYSPVDL